MIQERLNLLKPYFKGLKVAESYRIAEFNLKRGWEIPENDKILVQQKEVKDNGNMLYNMFYSDTKTFDQIIDFVEEEVIKHNLEIEEKEALLRAKVEELKRVFENKPLTELNNLKFTTEDDSLKLTSRKLEKDKISQNGSTKEFSENSQSK